MKKKEFLVIFVLAVLVTAGSWFYFRHEGCLMQLDFSRKGMFCQQLRGWPLSFWQSFWHLKIQPFRLLIDILFWFLVLAALYHVGHRVNRWWVVKKLEIMNEKLKIGLVGLLMLGVILFGGWWLWRNQLLDGILASKYCRKDSDCAFTQCCGCASKCYKICSKRPFAVPCECKNNQCIVKQTQKVTITTDKAEYEQGEKIEAVLSWEGTIYTMYGSSIQRWEEGVWVDVQTKSDPYFFCANMPECKEVNLELIEECPPFILCEQPTWSELRQADVIVWDQNYLVEKKMFRCNFIQRLPDDRITSQKQEERTCVTLGQAPPGKYKIRFEYALSLDPADPQSREIEIKYAEAEFRIIERRGETIEVSGRIYNIGNDPFTQLAIETDDGLVYGLISKSKVTGLGDLGFKRAKVKGYLLGRTPPSFRTEKSIDVIDFEVIE